MIEIAKSTLRSTGFRTSLTKLAECQTLDTKVAYRLMRTMKLLDKGAIDTQKGWVELLKKYVPVDAEGKFTLNDAGTEFAWLETVDPEEAKKAIMAFGETNISVDRDRFELDDFKPAKLSAVDLAELEPLYNQPE